MIRKNDWGKLALCVFGSEIIGASGGLFTASSVGTWYKVINKPFFTPPSWVFGPAWTLLFALMGAALYLVLRDGTKNAERKRAITLFVTQFAFNIAWSLLFFGLKMPWFAYVDILIMWFLILLTIKSFYRINKLAGWLLIPYIAWVTFASFLNLGVAILN